MGKAGRFPTTQGQDLIPLLTVSSVAGDSEGSREEVEGRQRLLT